MPSLPSRAALRPPQQKFQSDKKKKKKCPAKWCCGMSGRETIPGRADPRDPSFKSRWTLRSRAAPGPGWVPEPPARLRGSSRWMLCLPRCSRCPTGTIPELPRLSKGSLIPDFIPGGSLGRLLYFNPSSRASKSEQQRSPKDVFTSPASSEEERCLAIHVTRSRALDSQPWECARHSQSHRLLPTSRLPGLDKLCCSPSPNW